MLNWHTGNIQRVARRPALTTCGCLLPDSGDREAIELNVLDDFVQEPVSHGIEICKRVHLQTERRRVLALLPLPIMARPGRGPMADVGGMDRDSASRKGAHGLGL